MKKLYMIDMLSQFRIRYAVEADSIDDAVHMVYNGDHELKEFSQTHLGILDFSSREITQEEYLKLFDEDNEYLSNWTTEQKLKQINKGKPKSEEHKNKIKESKRRNK